MHTCTRNSCSAAVSSFTRTPANLWRTFGGERCCDAVLPHHHHACGGQLVHADEVHAVLDQGAQTLRVGGERPRLDLGAETA